ncbi:Ubiquitin carboxyl-terminal hydrolase 15 [Rhynchospora pubera]|uniref:ubiquitinyl hydrolase 1 n=1 Tax=Rhynchospora pubera TaxID=906938 RepID=A0AAV8DQB8_9POAL|nr:Ubiquitin carboxyl-terminal hydrolase 15 [Rhynchospora pubera]
MLKPREADVPTFIIVLVVLPIVTYILLGKWNDAVRKRARVTELAHLAFEESSRVEVEAHMASPDILMPASPVIPAVVAVPTVPVVPALRGNGYYYECATCLSPATTRCSRCKSVRYCSGKCQIIHWRQGHKDRCRPWNASATSVSGVAPQQMPYLVNLNSPLHGSESEQSMLSDSASDDQSGSQTESKFMNHVEKRSTNKLKQAKFRNGDCMDADSPFSEASSEVPTCNVSTSEEVLKNLDGTSVSKNVLRYHTKSTKESRKRNKPTDSAKSASSNSDCITTTDFEDGVHQDRGAVEQGESHFSEKNLSRGSTGYKKPPYSLGQSICVVQKPQDSRVVKEHFLEGDERNLCKKNESRCTSASVANNYHSNGLKNEVAKKPSKFLKYNLVGLINDSRKNKVPQVLFPYEELVKFFQYEVRGVAPRGLVNCGNSCYANAVLQCLTCTRPLMVYLLKRLHSENCSSKKWCLICELEQHASMLCESGAPLSLSGILSNMRNIGCRFGGGSQEDAHEFLRLLVMSMQSTCLEGLGGEKVVNPKLQETTLIQQIFGGRLKSKVICMRCHHESERYENIMDLTLEINGWVESLEDALTQFTSPEDLDGENMYRCERCSAYVRARKQLSVHEVPNILTIVLKRFQSGKYGKINKCVTFPEMLDMIPYVTGTADKPPLYLLYAVIVHLDNQNASFSGHYISYVKDMQGTWFRIDDSEVQVVQLSQVMSEGAYMLFYSRSSPRPPRAYMEKSPAHFPVSSKRDYTSKPTKSAQVASSIDARNGRYDFGSEHRQYHIDESAFPTSADFSDANSSSEWSLFTSSDESSFTTESTRDSFSMVDYGENSNSSPNTNPSLDPFASIFGTPYYEASCRPQTRYYVESSGTNGGVIRERSVDFEGCYVQTSGYCDM